MKAEKQTEKFKYGNNTSNRQNSSGHNRIFIYSCKGGYQKAIMNKALTIIALLHFKIGC